MPGLAFLVEGQGIDVGDSGEGILLHGAGEQARAEGDPEVVFFEGLPEFEQIQEMGGARGTDSLFEEFVAAFPTQSGGRLLEPGFALLEGITVGCQGGGGNGPGISGLWKTRAVGVRLRCTLIYNPGWPRRPSALDDHPGGEAHDQQKRRYQRGHFHAQMF